MLDLTSRFVEYVRGGAFFDDEQEISPDAIDDLYDKWLDDFDDELDGSPRSYIEGLRADGSVSDYAEVCFEEGWELDRTVKNALCDDKYRPFLEKYALSADVSASGDCLDCLVAMGGVATDDFFLKVVLSDGLDKTRFATVYDYLRDTDASVVDKILKIIYTFADKPEKQSILVEIMANYPGRKEVFMWLQTLLYRAEDVPFVANLIGAYGDEDGINVMKQFAKSVDLSYDEYVEIRNAVEQLGGHFYYDKDFSEDGVYLAAKAAGAPSVDNPDGGNGPVDHGCGCEDDDCDCNHTHDHGDGCDCGCHGDHGDDCDCGCHGDHGDGCDD